MGGRILIADTVPTNRISLKVKLSAARYAVEMAASGVDAMMKAKAFHPHLIILAAEIDGGADTLCATFKSDPDLAHVPVVVIGAQTAETRLAALRAGAEDVWPRPVDAEMMTARIRTLMRVATTADELRRREETGHLLGQPAPDTPATAPRVMLAGAAVEDAMKWRAGLSGLMVADFDISRIEGLAETLNSGADADAIVIQLDLRDIAFAARTLSDLRNRPAARYAAILVIHPRGQDDLAMTALDMGAADVLAAGTDPEELALRLDRLVARKREADRLRAAIDDGLRLAAIDSLTGLYNRRYAMPHLDAIAKRSHDTDTPFCVMLVDIDRFKRLNDTYGHATGDAVLVEVARRLRDNLRVQDMVARIGGEEFLIALPDTSLVEARRAADRLLAAISATPAAQAPNGTAVTTSISIGMAMGADIPAAQGGVERLVAIADAALYASKAEGRNQVTLGSHAA